MKRTFFFTILLCFWGCILASVKDCYQEGLFCESCSSLVHCTANGDGTFSKTSKGRCNHPQKCISGGCSENPEPICDGTSDLAFHCNQVGVFPHPFYCDKFVMCVDDWGLKAFVNECEKGYGYNIRTKNCDVKLRGAQCKELTYPVPECEALLQSGALVEDPTIYYRCQQVHKNLFETVLYPVLYKCDHGLHYDERKDQCL